ncbi:MAG: hypothetical protein IID46_07545, partial [Planctomycetes bacterium]|nr:hypothetical protein [Planctomycetota bacterium]
MPRMIDKLNTGERYMYLDAVSVMARGGTDMTGILRGGGNAGGGNQLAIGIKTFLSKTMIDWDEVLRTGNETYDVIVKAARNSTRSERTKAFNRFNEELKLKTQKARATFSNPLGIAQLLFFSRKAKSRIIGEILNSLLLPGMTSAVDAEDRGTTKLQLAQLAYALAGSRAKHGRYP